MNKETYEESGFQTKSAAARAERSKREELENPSPLTTPTVSFHELATLYLDHCNATFQPNTTRYKKQYYKAFFNAVINHEGPEKPDEKQKGRKAPKISKLPSEIQVDLDTGAENLPTLAFAKFLDTVAVEQGRKISNRYLKDLKALYTWGVKSGYVKKNPLRHIEPKGEDIYRKYVPPLEDITAVLLAADQQEMDLIITLYGTGARISEVCRLTWEDVNLSKNALTLWTRKRKGGGMQPDTLTMTEKLQKVMHRRWENRDKQSQFVFCKPDGTPYTKDSHFIRMLMPRLCKRAGVKPFGYHSIRHKVATILMDSGKATLSNIQHFLRHNRPTTTENYLKSLSPGSQEMAGILDTHDKQQSVTSEKKKEGVLTT